ncbi:MAG: acetyl-CoA carboxylase biotin carboxyl carrier protein [Candidatus Omnitrophota bacterium]|nr:acetyl-CoA carboxylase biotin carboxyl carrier protein [Candidatus Omnitrophota bacterium]
MNIKKIKELIDLMNGNGLTEIEVEEEGQKIKLSKKGNGTVESTAVPSAHAFVPAGSSSAGTGAPVKSGKEVKTPMVGTFYRAVSPESAPFVEVGDIVKKGDVLCIIEAMKLMNEIKAEFGGRVAEILAENAEAVEFGQTLFLIEPA